MYTLRKPVLALALAAAAGVGYVASSAIHAPATSAEAITMPVAPASMAMTDKKKDIHLIFMAGRRLHFAARILSRGEKEYGGHRVAALAATREALEQCKAAILFVRANHPPHGG